MDDKEPKEQDGLGRRAFLRSVFGLSQMVDSEPAEAKKQPSGARFFWANVTNGQMGFPTGQSIPAGKPGSIMKIVACAALLETRIATTDSKFECRGSYGSGSGTVHCLYPHGVVDLVHALGLSCNAYFAHFSEKLSSKVMLDFACKFGLNSPLGRFPAGKFPETPAALSLNYVLGLDPQLEPTALEILRVAAIVATKGNVPHLHSAEAPEPDKPPFEVTLDGATWNALRQGMQIAGRQGTGKKLDPENKMHIALKTGTTPYGKQFQSWVCGYFPWTKPTYAFCLRSPSGTSYDVAIPALRQYLLGTDWPV